MLNFTEQTGCGAVMLVWSFPQVVGRDDIIICRYFGCTTSVTGLQTTNQGICKRVFLNKGVSTTVMGLLPVLWYDAVPVSPGTGQYRRDIPAGK
jgi:hypothetical protein